MNKNSKERSFENVYSKPKYVSYVHLLLQNPVTQLRVCRPDTNSTLDLPQTVDSAQHTIGIMNQPVTKL
jgi:hypothetical protein